MDDVFTLKIQSLVFGGYGLSRLPDGKAVFVPFVLPGETICAKIIEEKKGHVLAKLIEVENPHIQRITPRCAHYGLCGGCHYQHIPYALQMNFKQVIFIEQLQRIAGIEAPVVDQFIASTQVWSYRNAMQFSLGMDGKLCFADFYTNKPFEVRECHLPMAEMGNLWHLLEFEPGIQLDRVEVRQNNDGDLMLILSGSEKNLPEMELESQTSVIHVSGADQVVMAGNDHLMMHILEKDIQLSAGSFFQTNLGASTALINEIVGIVKQYACKSIMDVYCGVGLFSAFLAEDADAVIAIEYSSTACEDFAVNLDAYDNVSLYQGKAESLLPILEAKPDCIIVDPPRSGLKREATQAIVEKSPRLLIYVSCNPSTLARDVKHLSEAGYTLVSSTLVDMFPQTFHIESVNVFLKHE